MNLKEKLLNYAQKTDFSKAELARRIGIAKSNFVGEGLNSELNGAALQKFCMVFPNVSAEWLLRGTEPMMLTDQPPTAPPATHETNVNNGVNLGKIGSDHTTIDADERQTEQISEPRTTICTTCDPATCIFIRAKQEVIDAQRITISALKNNTAK